jgi:phage tail sheath protein FI
MPQPLSYPGVYIQELPSGVRSIAGVATSITAFVGRAWSGPVDEPVMLFSFADFERRFGGLWQPSALGHTVQQFFLNGGSQAVVVRVTTREGDGSVDPASFATLDLGAGNSLVAASPGTWGRNLVASVDHQTKDKDLPVADQDDALFNLTLLDDPDTKADADARGGSGATETFLNVSMDSASPRFVTTVLAQQSALARVAALGGARPAETTAAPALDTSGDDGIDLVDSDVVGSSDDKTGIYALKQTDLFNLLCLPPLTPGAGGTDIGMSTWTAAAAYCNERRAFLLVDAPQTWKVSDAVAHVSDFSAVDRNHSALYFPRLRIPDPLQENRLVDCAPCGVVAGIMSRTDAARGVWKAPAGIEANLQGVLGLSIGGVPGNLIDGEVGQLNPLGVNSLRGLPVIGHVAWGARTLEGADTLSSQWKYIPVRRLALFLEESLFRGTQWVVFEPNDEPLWAQIRLNVGAFMNTLFRQGAFQGTTPRDAYFVKCSSETTTQTDIDNGIVNIVVGFAPLKPAEFVVIKIQQISQQA